MSKKTDPAVEEQEIYATADPVELPENAFRELAADETYRPIMHPAHDYPEVTPYSVTMGLLLAVVLFLKRVMENSTVRVYGEQLDAAEGSDLTTHEVLQIAPGVSVYEIDGPFFFGVATKFEEVMRSTNMKEKPCVRIIRMRKVPFIDATGVHNLEMLIRSSQSDGIEIVLSGVNESVSAVLHKAGIDNLIGSEHICPHISVAVEMANRLAKTMQA